MADGRPRLRDGTALGHAAGDVLDRMAGTPDLPARMRLLEDLYDVVVPVVGGLTALMLLLWLGFLVCGLAASITLAVLTVSSQFAGVTLAAPLQNRTLTIQAKVHTNLIQLIGRIQRFIFFSIRNLGELHLETRILQRFHNPLSIKGGHRRVGDNERL